MNPVFKCERSGIIGRSNGSPEGNDFLQALNTAQIEHRREESLAAKKAKAAGAKLFHTWDGWFCLEENNWQSGHAPFSPGSKAKFTPPSYLYASFGIPQIGDYICIWDNGPPCRPLLMWKIINISETIFKNSVYIVEYSYKL